MLESPQVRAPEAIFGGFFASHGNESEPEFEPLSSMDGAARPLREILRPQDSVEVRGGAGELISDVTHRSSETRPGSLFFCVPGGAVDGHAFAAEAVERGAVAIVVERWLDEARATQVRVASVRSAMGPVSAAFFGRPSERIPTVGVTGTNGKTTTTYLVESIFASAGLAPGLIGTTGVRIAGTATPFDRTTPEAPDLQRLLARMVNEGVKGVAMEVSSHGLDQRRVDGTRYACAIFTNLSQDHLDYHQTMDAYFAAKARLFTPDLSDRAVVNVDSPEGRLLAEGSSIPTTTFGLGTSATISAKDVEVTASGLAFTVDGVRIRSPLRGAFNVYNCLGALAASRVLGIDEAVSAEGIERVEGIPGRLEPVESGQGFPVLVDYAHSPDSLENVLRALLGMTGGRVIVVFGCGGDRDRGKRPLMGEMATTLAGLSVITSDNPRSEDPLAIISEIESGARTGRGSFHVEPDRRAAIRFAVRAAGPEDVVLVAGKGHETGQEFRDRTVPFDDRVVAREEIEALLREADR
jgi:UDP-N-acetylmuramoyl-L-alanyl-D-glutamate--2,6-diaminopimelate ligase